MDFTGDAVIAKLGSVLGFSLPRYHKTGRVVPADEFERHGSKVDSGK